MFIVLFYLHCMLYYCLVILLALLVHIFTVLYLFYLQSGYLLPYSLFNTILSVNCLKFSQYFRTSLFLLTGHCSDLVITAFSLSRYCSLRLQLYIVWPTVCSPLLQEHFRFSIILYLCRYDVMLPCPVTKAVKLGVGLIRSFSLPTMMGKKDFVIMWK